MRLTLTPFPRLALTILLTACPPADPGATEPGSTGATITATEAQPTGTGAETGETGAETGDPNPASTGETTADATTGDDPADGCNTPDPAAGAGFSLDLGDLVGPDDFEIDLELACTVSATQSGGMFLTELGCPEGDVPHAVHFDVAATDLGEPAWSVGEAVTLRVWGVQQFGGLIEGPTDGLYAAIEVALHRDADGMLLASATRSYDVTADFYAPLEITADRDACGTDLPADDPGFPGPDRDMALTFELAADARTLFTQQRDQLPADAAVLAIDVGAATAIECCHNDRWIVAITRLVVPG